MPTKIDKNKEQELWQMWRQSPTEQNRNQLIELYLPHLEPMAGTMWLKLPMAAKTSIERGDLLGEVVICLCRCIELFDESKGCRFLTYSTYRVRGAMLDYLRRCDHLSRLHRRSENVFQPSNISTESVVRSDPDGKPLTLGEILCDDDDDHTRQIDSLDLVESILASLPADMAAVVCFYHLDGYKMREVGVILGVSESRVSQLLIQAMKLMRLILANRDKRESALRGPSG